MLHYNIIIIIFNYYCHIPWYTRNTNVCVKLCKQKNRLFLLKKLIRRFVVIIIHNNNISTSKFDYSKRKIINLVSIGIRNKTNYTEYYITFRSLSKLFSKSFIPSILPIQTAAVFQHDFLCI